MNEHTCHEFCPCQTGGEPLPDFVTASHTTEPRCVTCGQPFVNGDKIREVGMSDDIEIIHDACREAFIAGTRA